MSTHLELELMYAGRSGAPERRQSPRVEMHGPIARAGEALARQRQMAEDHARFRTLTSMDAQGLGQEITERTRAEVREALDIFPGVDVPAGKGLGQERRHSHQTIRRDFI